jgi:MFS family permease
MPSAPYPVGEKIRNVMSVVCGVLLFFALMFAILPVFTTVYDRMFPSKGVNTNINAAIWIFSIYLFLLLLICLLSGILTAVISTRKKILHSFITGCVLVLLYVVIIGTSVNWQSVGASNVLIVENIFIPIVLLSGPFAGGWVASRIFKKRKRV